MGKCRGEKVSFDRDTALDSDSAEDASTRSFKFENIRRKRNQYLTIVYLTGFLVV